MSIKKAELHVHLEGTIPPYLAKKLAERNRLTMPSDLVNPDGVSYHSENFLHFLKVYDTLAALIKKPEDYYDITFDYLRANALENTIYVEMMYSPDHAEQSSGIPSIEHLHAIQQAVDDAKAKYDIIGCILITAVRHFGAEAAIKVAKQGVEVDIPCVVGFGLGGDEMNFPPKDFKRAYEIAYDGGLKCTVHAGEFAPYTGMLEAIEHLPIQRIGHGVAAIQSAETMSILKEKQIALEICPSSNVFLGLFPNIAAHPLPQFLEAGLLVSINSDDPPFMKTTLAQEYEKTQRTFQFSNETMNHITKMAVECAFVDEKTKQSLIEKL